MNHLNGKKHTLRNVTFAIIAFLFFTIGIPIIVNETYKYGSLYGGYVTIWNAADVLSYYGTLLGSVTTVVALMATIAFTKKQIEHNRFIEYNYAKWENIESIITKILADISPLHINDFGERKDTTMEMVSMTIIHLQTYENTIKASLDTMKCYINPHDFQQLTAFTEKLSDCITLFSKIEQDLKMQAKGLILDTYMNQGTIPNYSWSAFYEAVGEIDKKILSAHDGPYQELLDKKCEVFDKIYTDIEQHAVEILQFIKNK